MRFLILGLLVFLTACTSKPDITTDYEHAADFARYRSFAFEPKLATDSAGYSSLTTQRIKAAVQREMASRGYVYGAMSMTKPIPACSSTSPASCKRRYASPRRRCRWAIMYGYYGYRAGLYGPWPGYAMDTQVDQYTEGAIRRAP